MSRQQGAARHPAGTSQSATSRQVSIMSISRKSGASAPENHPFVSGTAALYVVCMRDTDPCYLAAPLRAWIAGLNFPDCALIGIYPSFLAAKAVAEQLNLLWGWDGSDKAWIGGCGVWIGGRHKDTFGKEVRP